MTKPDKKNRHSQIIRVLFTGPDLERSVGGIQTHANLFIQAFKCHASIKIDFFRTSLGLYKSEAIWKKLVRIFKLSHPFYKSVRQSDVVHINSSFGTAPVIRDYVYVAIARYLAKKPVVVQFHGGLPDDLALLRNRLTRSALSRVLFQAERILILSNAQLTSLRKFLPDVKAQIVPNFIDALNIKNDKRPKSYIQFLFMARIAKNKGLEEIVSASQQLSKTHPDFRIVLCGDGPDVLWLKDLLRSSNQNNHIVFLGRVSGDQKADVLDSSHVFLLPSRHREGFPYGILEAFNHSMPVIASRVGAIPDVIEHGVTGLLLDEPSSEALSLSMLYMLENIEEITKMGNTAKRTIDSNYSIPQLLTVFSNIYSETAEKG